MYMIEITEDKFDNALEHLSKGIKCLAKGIEMFEEIKESSHYEEYDERSRHRYGGMREDYDRERPRGEGRYGRY